MKKVKLDKAWGPSKIGDVVEVDDLRAEKLIADKMGKDPGEPEAKKGKKG